MEHHTPAQVLVGASLGSAVALVWFALWEGGDAISFFTSVENIPRWLLLGGKEQGLLWERALEDVVFLALEAWEAGDWTQLIDSLKQFPLVASSVSNGDL